ncbi:MAG: LysO family transporter [Bilophila sp.]
MLVEIGCMVLGVPVGYVLRNSRLAIRITDLVLTWSVRILLLLLGLALGADADLMSRMDSLGVRGTFISLCCVAGSLIGARLLEPYMNRSQKKKNSTVVS